MNNDLISRSALIEYITSYDNRRADNMQWDRYAEIVANQPVAYNTEKIAEQVGEEFKRTVAELLEKTGSELQLCDFNIKPFEQRLTDIVKEGGVNEESQRTCSNERKAT